MSVKGSVMQRANVSFIKSVKGKILVWVTLILVVFLSILMLVAYSNMEDKQKSIASHLIVSTVQSAADDFSRFNSHGVDLAKMLAVTQKTSLYPNREASLEHIKESLQANPEILGSFLIYEPKSDQAIQQQRLKELQSADGADAASMQDVQFKQFAPNWSRGDKRATELELAELKIGDKPAYQAVLDKVMSGNKDLFAIAEPYVRGKHTIVETAYPIIKDGEFMGIAGVDQSLDSLKNHLSKLKPFETTDYFIISRSGVIIANTLNDALDGRKQNDTSYSDVLSHFIHEKRQSKTAERFADQLEKKEYFYSAAPVEVGGWLVVARVQVDEVLAPVQAALWRWVILTVGGLAAFIAFLFFLSRNITSAIGKAQDITLEVSSGNLSVAINNDREDEVGSLMDSLKEMNEKLFNLVNNVKRSTEEITKTADNIENYTQEEKDKTSEFLELTNEVVKTVKSISQTSMGLVKTMKEINEAAQQTTGLADSGRSGLSNMEEAMHHLQDSTKTIASKFAVLNDKANNINSVVTTINKVADQTNLLSLNAAIEAEKAGEQGLGFAVVATEIRRLADQTAIATLDIEQMVKEVQEAVSSGVIGMENFSKEVDRSIEDVASLGKQLSQIIEQVKALIKRFESVSGGVDEQLTGAQEVSQFISKLSSSVEETSNSLKTFHLSTKSLKNYTQVLQDEVAYFKTND